jgi:hypothetical protein
VEKNVEKQRFSGSQQVPLPHERPFCLGWDGKVTNFYGLSDPFPRIPG